MIDSSPLNESKIRFLNRVHNGLDALPTLDEIALNIIKGMSMKQNQVTVGMQVVVNDLPDTTIYTVKSIDSFIVELVYYTSDGTEYNGGQVDVSMIKKPTQKQLKGKS